MVKLPDSWEWKKIGEIAETTSGGTPLRSHAEYYGGNIPWAKSGELRDGIIQEVEETITEAGLRKSSAKLFPKNTVVVALYGATVGRTGILGIDATTNQAVCGIFPLDNAFISKYMFYWLQSQRQNLINQSMGGAQPNISQGIIRSLYFPLAPLPEQERIVAKIEELFTQLDAGTSALERVQAGLRRYEASVLKAACEGKLLGNEKVESGELPEGWEWKSASEFCVAVESGSTPKADLMTSEEGEIPFLKVYNLKFDGTLDFSIKPTFIGVETQTTKLKRSRVYPGDVLTNIVGPPLGKVSIVPDTYPEWNINQAIVLFRTGETVDNKYLSIVLQSPDFIKKIKATSKATAGQFNVSLTTCRTILMPIPPLEEQRRIVAEVERRLSVAREVESAVEEALVRASRLRQAVLKSAFEGRL